MLNGSGYNVSDPTEQFSNFLSATISNLDPGVYYQDHALASPSGTYPNLPAPKVQTVAPWQMVGYLDTSLALLQQVRRVACRAAWRWWGAYAGEAGHHLHCCCVVGVVVEVMLLFAARRRPTAACCCAFLTGVLPGLSSSSPPSGGSCLLWLLQVVQPKPNGLMMCSAGGDAFAADPSRFPWAAPAKATASPCTGNFSLGAVRSQE